MSVITLVLAVLSFTSSTLAQYNYCDFGATYASPIEKIVTNTAKNCFNYYVGPVVASKNLLLAFSNNQIACSQGQQILVLDTHQKPYYDVCHAESQGVTLHMISYSSSISGGYLIVQVYNPISLLMSTYIHYGLFNHLPSSGGSVSSTASSTKVSSTTASTKASSTIASTKTSSTIASTKASTTVSASTCGNPAITPDTSGLTLKIVGGTTAIAHSLPWQVMVITRANGYIYLCGGSLIDKQWIVTAAHCVESGGTTTIYLGAQYQSDRDTSNSIGISVSKIITNPGWNPTTMKNDIALMKLSQPVTFSTNIQPICLPSSDLATVGTYGLVSGWGDTSTNGQTSNPLMQAVIPINQIGSCGFGSSVDSTTQICAGVTSGSIKDTCQGDSGGPLVKRDANNHFTLVGITSFGGSSCNGQGIYTNVYAFVNWIKSTMASNRR